MGIAVAFKRHRYSMDWRCVWMIVGWSIELGISPSVEYTCTLVEELVR
jgi:hypothetical protein